MAVHVSATILRVTASLPDLPIHYLRDNDDGLLYVVVFSCCMFFTSSLSTSTTRLRTTTCAKVFRSPPGEKMCGGNLKVEMRADISRFLRSEKCLLQCCFGYTDPTMVCGCMCGCMGYVSAWKEQQTPGFFLIWGNHSELRSVTNGSRNTTRWPSKLIGLALHHQLHQLRPWASWRSLELLMQWKCWGTIRFSQHRHFPSLGKMRKMTWMSYGFPKRWLCDYFPSPWFVEFLHKHLKQKCKHRNIVRDYSYTHRPPVGQVITTLGKAAQWMLAIAFFSEMVRRFCANMPLAQGFKRMLFNSSKWTWHFGCSKTSQCMTWKEGAVFWHLDPAKDNSANAMWSFQCDMVTWEVQLLLV